MTKRRGKCAGPRIVYTRKFSENPGTQEELDEILTRWELALARRARELIRAERKSNDMDL